MAIPDKRDLVPVACLAAFTVVWIALAISPRYRADWLLENIPVFVAVPVGVFTYRRWRFSDRAYLQMTAFLLLHAIGAHHTYSEVPIGDWLREAFDWSRNHYDRVVHFSFGLLMLRPAREISFRGREPGTARALVLSIAAIAALSVVYEILEWLTASMVDPRAGTAYLGTQGDQWDAQKDMALACTGAIAAAGFELLRSRRLVSATRADGAASA